MNMTGIIFSNLFDENFGVLTKNRTVASLPFAGRYRFIDFVLSDMSNSNITDIGIITKSNYKSLMDHLGSCAAWDLDRKNGGRFPASSLRGRADDGLPGQARGALFRVFIP